MPICNTPTKIILYNFWRMVSNLFQGKALLDLCEAEKVPVPCCLERFVERFEMDVPSDSEDEEVEDDDDGTRHDSPE